MPQAQLTLPTVTNLRDQWRTAAVQANKQFSKSINFRLFSTFTHLHGPAESIGGLTGARYQLLAC